MAKEQSRFSHGRGRDWYIKLTFYRIGKGETMETQEDYPCDCCGMAEHCDGWDSRFCCMLCQWIEADNCNECDPNDI